MLVDGKGTLWVATDHFNFRLGKDSAQPNTILTLAPNAKRFAATGHGVGMIRTMAASPDGSVWMVHTSRDVVFAATQNWSKTSISVNEPMSLLFDGDDSIWIGLARGGLRRLNLANQDHPVLEQFQMSDGLSNNTVYSTFKDREGNIWFGTGAGLDRFRDNKATSFSAKEDLVPDEQLAITSTADGSVWFASYSGDVVQRFRAGRFISSKLPPYPRSEQVTILSLHADGNGHIWVGGPFKLAEADDLKFSYSKVSDMDEVSAVHAITHDALGNLWVTVWNDEGGGVLRLRNGKWISFRSSKVHLPLYRCRVLYGDPQGRVWFGFEDGEVAVYENAEFRVYSSKDGLPDGRVFAITSDRAGHIWIGGEAGLTRFDPGHFVTLTKENGLPGNSISGIVEDDDGYLWLAGALAILRVDPLELERAFRSSSYRIHGDSFDASDGFRGLPRQREPFPTVTKAADGRLWFSTTAGVAVIDPRHLPKNILPPPVTIEAIKADNAVVTGSSELRLRPETRNLEFEYAALSLTDPERVRFRYKLEGYDDDWRGPVTARDVRYTNLPPRNYRFRVIACNNDGVWNETGASLDFYILPAFYQTNWFRALSVAAFLALLWAVHRVRVRQLRRREKKLRDVIETMPTFAWTALPDGSVDFVNRHWQQYSGLSAGKSAGAGWEAAVHPSDLKRHADKWRASVASGGPFESEVRYRRATDGQYRWFLVRAVTLRDGRGNILKWYGISTDIEDRKRAEEERETLRADLAHGNRVSMLGELTASLSHELKQPIAAAMTNARTCSRWLKRDQPDVQEACAAADNIVNDGKRATEIIERLRSLYKKAPPQRELVDINEIIREMVVLLRGEANRYAVSIRTELAAEIPRITADRVQLQQVLMNLMLNGIEAMKETGGVLTVKSRLAQDGRVLISVSDTGEGLPAEKADQIFSAFFTTKAQGSGMGLAISRSIVESHGGCLWANANDGRGATFHFTLPVVAATAPPASNA